jgi:hypothetical protein
MLMGGNPAGDDGRDDAGLTLAVPATSSRSIPDPVDRAVAVEHRCIAPETTSLAKKLANCVYTCCTQEGYYRIWTTTSLLLFRR